MFNVSAIRPLLLAALLGLSPSWCAAAGEGSAGTGATIEHISVGFDGSYKVGCWTPLTATVSTARPMRAKLVVESLDPDGSPTRLPGSALDVPSPGRSTFRALFKSGRLNGSLRLQLREGKQTLATRILHSAGSSRSDRPAVLRQSAFLVVAVGHPAGFSDIKAVSDKPARFSDGAQSAGANRFRVVEQEGFDPLPIDADAYDSVDALVVAGRYDLDRLQSDAIRDWVREGGHLVLSVGSNVSGYKSSRFDEWVPVPVEDEPLKLRQLSGLETFADQNVRIVFSGRVNAARIDTQRLKYGRILASGLDGPLLLRVPLGFGQITFFALDLDRPPLTNWEPLASICRRIVVGDRQIESKQGRSEGNRLTQTGITDLATQLHAAQEHFPDVHRLSSWPVMGLLVVYLLLIGPVDYLLVHRLLRRPHWTWFTFPVLVVACAGAAVWGARYTNGEEVRVNQIDLLDIDAKSQFTRGRSWLTIYSPRNRRYDVAVQLLETAPRGPGVSATGAGSRRLRSGLSAAVMPRISWNGIPEDCFGGMYRPGGLEFGRAGYRFAENAAALEGLPVATWSTKGLTARWSSRDHAEPPLVESRLWSSGTGDLKGVFSHRLPGAIQDWMIAYGNRVYRPATGFRGGGQFWELPPNQGFNLQGAQVNRRELKGYLTGTKQKRVAAEDDLTQTQILIEQSKYNPLDRDPTGIMRMISFHQAAGGKAYTGLDNNTLRRFDLSAMLDLNRAVLFGRVDRTVARLLLDGQVVAADRQETIVRIVLPVENRGDARRRQLMRFENN